MHERAKIKEDKTPVGKARRRKPTTHQRLRLEKAKALKRKGALTKKKREAAKKQKPGETDPEKMVQIVPHLPELKKNTLSKPPKPPAKFRKRQIHKSWLPTHLWHAKRASMTEPKYPLWRFAIPLTPREKCFRSTHRSAAMRGCVAWDMSYMGTLGLEGAEASLLGALRSVGVEEAMLSGKAGVKWRKGTRSWQGWIRQRDPDHRWIAPVTVVWCAEEEEETVGEGVVPKPKKRAKRKMLLRVHPSALLRVWDEILKVSKMQRPQTMVEDLRFEIGSIEIAGPGSTEALIGALHPVLDMNASAESYPQKFQTIMEASAAPPRDHEWIDIETPQKLWTQLASLTNPSTLPANALLAFNITDPRLHHPPRTIALPEHNAANEILLPYLASWPPDQTQPPADIFNRTKRLTASRLLASQKSINRRKAAALPGEYPDPMPKDPQVPIVLLTSRPAPPNSSSQGTWTLFLPWDCVLPVWYSLMHYPLAIGGTPRFGCLQEKQQIAFEQGNLWFPGDFPGTEAGWDWEIRNREVGKSEWDRQPKGKRTEWSSIDLGDGRKGEIGKGWACDWERLMLGKEAAEASDAAMAKDVAEEGLASQPNDQPRERGTATDPPTDGQLASQTSKKQKIPPYEIHHFPRPVIRSLVTNPTISIPSTALTPIYLHLLATGHPQRCARIYRLPTTNRLSRSRWLSLASSTSPGSGQTPAKRKDSKAKPPFPSTAAVQNDTDPSHQRIQALAASLLTPIRDADGQCPKPGNPTYPLVPDEEDLIGFITSANYDLGTGHCGAIGNVFVTKALSFDLQEKGIEGGDGVVEEGAKMKKTTKEKIKETNVEEDGNDKNTERTKPTSTKEKKDENKWKEKGKGKGKQEEKFLCIIRNAGQSFGRLARWQFAV